MVVKDGDDARNLISVVLAQFMVVGAMLGVGLIWASVQATHALHEYSTLSPLTDESKGSSYPTLSGSISFFNVQFNYPS